MIPPLQTNQLVERIGLAARQTLGGGRRASMASIAKGELPPVPESVPSLPPVQRATDAVKTPEFPLDEVANMLPRARSKITVSENLPTWLRPFYRNQGGFNHILLETLERLLEANRQLQRQNHELQGRVVAMGGWIDTVAEISGSEHDWMLAVENRLRAMTPARLAELETRLAALEGKLPVQATPEPVGQQNREPELPPTSSDAATPA